MTEDPKIYANIEDLEKDYPGINEEMKARTDMMDERTSGILKERGYPIVREWEGHSVYQIPIEDLLGVWSARKTRRCGSYRHYITEMHNGTFSQVPLLCFVAMDGRLRVKYGNVIYWVAKETRKVPELHCVFPKGPEATDALQQSQLREAGMQQGVFL
jgi:hypothetical protein